MNRRIAVIGGGLTGLAAACHLRQLGAEPLLLESSPRVGGAIRSSREGDWLHEAGPNTLLANTPVVTEFLAHLGLASRTLTPPPTARHRYVLRGGIPRALPGSPPALLGGNFFSWLSKLRLLREPFVARAAPDADESIADFTRRRLGREFLDYAVNPFVAGIYAGDPARLSVRHGFPKLHALEQRHGSLLRGLLAARRTAPRGGIVSFPEGLEEIPRAAAALLGPAALALGAGITALAPAPGDQWLVRWGTPSGAHEEIFSRILIALPAAAAARLPLPAAAARALAILPTISHPPVASVFLGFTRAAVAHPLDGFGLLVPAIESRRTLGTLFSSSLFPGRAPADHVALTTFVGGTRQPENALLDDEALIALVLADLVTSLGVTGAPRFARIVRWPRAIPQYEVGYARFEAAFAAAERACPGLHFGGHARDGVALGACIESGQRLARLSALQARDPKSIISSS